MLSGKLKNRAIIQQPVKTRGSSGEQLITWQTIATRWVNVVVQPGTELKTRLQTVAQQKYVVIIRYDDTLAGITVDWRLLVDSTVMRVESVSNVGLADRELRLQVEVVVQ